MQGFRARKSTYSDSAVIPTPFDMSLITLMTDFGTCDGYVGVMKGVIAQIAAGVAVVDLTHDIAPQDVMAARFVAMNSYRFFPAGTVHCLVVDPGVGTHRRAIALEVEIDGKTQHFVAPDNGILDGVLTDLHRRSSPSLNPGSSHSSRNGSSPQVKRVVSLTNADYWRTLQPSQTFHGRDIFAPVAAHLAAGIELSSLGNAISAETLVRMSVGDAIASLQGYQGVIQYIDRFGNAITNIPALAITSGPSKQPRAWQVGIKKEDPLQTYGSYGDADPGEPLGLLGSHGWVEIAVNGGSAAEQLDLQVGTPVSLAWC